MLTLKVKVKSNIKLQKDTASHGNVDTAVRETLDTHQRKFVKANLSTLSEESRCDQKDEDVPEEGMPAKSLPIKGTLGDIS